MSLGTEIDRLREMAMSDLQAAAGDLSMCAIAKSGEPMPALKYFEGRVAMLQQLQRVVSGDFADEDLVAGIRSTWDAKRPLAARSRDWEAYLRGGDDVLTELAVNGG